MERRADEAERELLQWKKVRFMADKVGDEYEGFVTGVTPFGLFVELVEHYVEGLVHVSSMADDYYRFVEQQHVLYGENTKKTYRLGGKVRVQVVRVDLERRQIDLGAGRDPGRRARGGPAAADPQPGQAENSEAHAPGTPRACVEEGKAALTLFGRLARRVVGGGLAGGVLEVANALADAAAQFGQAVRAEDDDRDHEHDQDFGHAKVHTTPVRRAVSQVNIPGPGRRIAENCTTRSFGTLFVA